MDQLLFGISGLPIPDGGRRFNYASAIGYLKSFGLDAMELLFVRTVNVTEQNKNLILKAKLENKIYLSAHGSHYINLNADEPIKQDESLARIIKAAEGLAQVEGKSLIFHPGYYLSDSPADTLETIKKNLARLPAREIDYRLETTGKRSQFGTVPELVALCQAIPSCKLCIDFAHIHARGNGSLRNYADFGDILQYVADKLGKAVLNDLHIHMGGICYNQSGERHHLPLRESDFNYMACLKALKDFGIKGCVIAEGPRLQYDALILKNTYLGL
ncbi:MAG TPA: AP endonuclease [Firmicutes bacterium]|jgi:deoxyribonuclease IV|nr:AP endonuclease [Bacillota bacterium]